MQLEVMEHYGIIKYFRDADYFETDHQRRIFNQLKKVILASEAEIPVSDVLQYADRIVELVTFDSTLPIGFSTSPSISNACLYNFDNRIQQRASELGVTYTRYADDIIFSSQSKDGLTAAIQLIEPILQELFGNKIRINQSKNRTISVGKKVKILGVNILPNGKLTVDRKIKDRVETTLHYFKTNRAKYEELVSENDDSKLERISGSLNYIKTIDPDYLNKLRKKYGSTTVDMFLRKSVK
jgi:RNA-directed DNA polymerase